MKFLALVVCLVSLEGALRAQPSWHGYLFAAPTLNNGSVGVQSNFGILPLPPPSALSTNPGASNTFAAGGGVEFHFDRWVGAGVDLSGIVPEGGRVIDNTVGTFSPNIYGHLGKWTKIDIYGTVGYTSVFQTYGANGFNWGVGVNYWFQTRGFMLEFRRIQVEGSNPPVTGSPYSEIRFGFTFRSSLPH